MADYVKDFGDGFKIQKVYANEWEGTYGNIYEFESEVKNDYPDGKILKGYVVVSDVTGLVPPNCNDWNKSIEDAISDYEEHIHPFLGVYKKSPTWFALDEQNCICVWGSFDKEDGSQFQMNLEKRAEDGSMGYQCEVISDESYATKDMSGKALCDTLKEICDDADIVKDNMDSFLLTLSEAILYTFELDVQKEQEVAGIGEVEKVYEIRRADMENLKEYRIWKHANEDVWERCDEHFGEGSDALILVETRNIREFDYKGEHFKVFVPPHNKDRIGKQEFFEPIGEVAYVVYHRFTEKDFVNIDFNTDLEKKDSLSKQILSASSKVSPASDKSVVSVAYFAENDEVKNAVLQSDMLRNKTLDICYSIPGYSDLPLNDKNKLYDLVKKSLIISQEKKPELESQR